MCVVFSYFTNSSYRLVLFKCIHYDYIRDRPFNLKGEGLWFFVSFGNLFSDNTRDRIFFCREFNIRLYVKTLNQIFFSFTKIRIFFQQHWESEYFLEKNHNPPLQVKWSFPKQTDVCFLRNKN